MSTSSNTRVRAALHATKLKILLLLAVAEAIYTAMLAAVVRFPAPVPTLAILLAQITALKTAQQVVSARSGGEATATRNTARDALWSSLQSLKAYVQTIADANEVDAIAIIKSAGFDVAAPALHTKAILEAQLTAVSGVVKLDANASALTAGSKKRPTFNWQYSVDGGHTWVSVPSTPVATTTVSGLPVMTNCSFRVSVTLKQSVQPWSQVITIPVH